MKVIFLDRDGVINNFPGAGDYIKSWEEFKFLPGAIEAIKRLTQNRFEIFVISNQAGVSKGIYTKNALDDITSNMLSKIETSGGRIRDVFYCIHKDSDDCSCRKPKTGLITKVFNQLHLKTSANSNNFYFIGDSMLDIEAGKNAHLKTILVLTGKERLENKENWNFQPDFIAKDISSAVDIVLKGNSKT